MNTTLALDALTALALCDARADRLAADLAAAEAHVQSLEADVRTYRAMVQLLLTRAASDSEQIRRLEFRIERGR
jgi:hypothetical protein